MILFIFGMAYLIKNYQHITKNIYLFYYLCILLLTIDSIIIVVFEFNILGNKIEESARIKSFFGDEEIMGSFVSRTLPLMIGVSYFFNIKNKNFFINSLIFLAISLVILSAERTAIANMIIFLFFYLIINKKFIKKIFIFFIVALSLIYLINQASLNRIINHTRDQIFNNKNINNNFLVFSLRHTLHYATALMIFKDYPFLGGGIKSFRYICSETKYVDKLNSIYKIDSLKEFQYLNGCNTHPHNIYLQFLSETGIIGFLLFSSIFIYVVYKLFVLIKKFSKLNFENRGNYFFLVAIFISMFPILPSGNYFNNWYMFVNYLPIGFYLASKIK